MSAKYLRKKKNKTLLWILALLLVAAVGAAVFLINGKHPAEESSETEAVGMQTISAGNASGVGGNGPSEMELPIDLGEGLMISKISNYTGLYLEDGTDEVVSGILMLELENTAEEDLQLARITLEYQDRTAEFTVTNLPAGKKAVLLEQNRMEYADEAPKSATAQNTVFLPEFGMHEDELQITALDGVINVKNITDKNIDQDIFVYYKNIAGGVYYGGITYRARIKGGLKAGEIRQLMTRHYDADGSEILMVSYVG